MVIDNNGIEFFKLYTPILKLTSVKIYSMAIGHYWYSSNDGIIIVACSPPKLGQFCTFFVNQNKGSKLFNGPKFSLDLSPCVTDKWTLSSSNVSSLADVFINQESNAPHQLSVVSLYNTSYILHIQCLTGLL